MSTPDLILGAAESRFAAVGYRGARLSDITGDVGLTPGAVYSSFEGKEDVFLQLFDRWQSRVMDRLKHATTLRDAVHGWIAEGQAGPGVTRAAFELCTVGSEFWERWADARAARLVALRKLVGPLAKGANARALAALIGDTIEQQLYSEAASWWAPRKAKDRAECLVQFVERGLYRDTGRPKTSGSEILAPMSASERRVEIFKPFTSWMPSETRSAPTSKRGRETWDRIREAATEVFLEQGMGGSTIPEIAKRAGVQPGTLYRYFEDKHDIFRSLQASLEEDIISHAHLPLSPEGHYPVAKSIAQYLLAYRRNAGIFRAWWEAIPTERDAEVSWLGMRKRYEQRLAHVIRGGVERGLAHPDIDVELMTEVITAMYERICHVRVSLECDDGVSDAVVVKLIHDISHGGLLAPPPGGRRPPVKSTGAMSRRGRS